MKKNRIFITLLSISMILAVFLIPSIKVEANDKITFKDIEVVETNEFLSVINEKEKLVDEMNTGIVTIDKLEYYSTLCQMEEEIKNHIMSLKTLSVDELKEYNYTDEQITAIKKYDGSYELTVAASAYVSASMTKTAYSYNSSTNKTTFSARFTGQWVGSPAFKSIDEIGIAVGGSEAGFSTLSSSTTVYYNDGSSTKQYGKRDYFGGSVHQIYLTSTNGNASFMKSYSMSITLVAGGKVSVAGLAADYVHQSISFGTGLSISVSGIAPSFSIGTGWSEEFYDYKTFYL